MKDIMQKIPALNDTNSQKTSDQICTIKAIQTFHQSPTK